MEEILGNIFKCEILDCVKMVSKTQNMVERKIFERKGHFGWEYTSGHEV